jgi:hypothetical protein
MSLDELARAKARLAEGKLTASDLDALHRAARHNGNGGAVRQRLLYLHAANPSVYSPLLNATLIEPVEGQPAQVDPLATPLPYRSVHDAIRDGWRVVQFPDQRAPFDDREIDIVGYEFILEKLQEAAS